MSASPPPKRPLIQASELAQYGFCHRAWWLGAVKKLPSRQRAARARGQRYHEQHARQLGAASRWGWLGWGLLLGGLGLLVVLMGLWFF